MKELKAKNLGDARKMCLVTLQDIGDVAGCTAVNIYKFEKAVEANEPMTPARKRIGKAYMKSLPECAGKEEARRLWGEYCRKQFEDVIE